MASSSALERWHFEHAAFALNGGGRHTRHRAWQADDLNGTGGGISQVRRQAIHVECDEGAAGGRAAARVDGRHLCT